MSDNNSKAKALHIALSGHNLLICGAAGTGKSFTIGHIVRELEKVGKNVSLTCTTGIACSLYREMSLNATTLHRWSGIDDGRYNACEIKGVIENNVKYSNIVNRIKKTDILIIDEVSMLSKKMFLCVSEVCCIKDETKLFGGMQLILCGDFYQLSPVHNTLYCDEGKYCFECDFFSTVVRQSDKNFVNVIQEVSRGCVSKETIDFIHNLDRHLEPQNDKDIVKVFATNERVADFNRSNLLKMDGPVYEYISQDTGEMSMLSHVLAPHKLWLKVGAPVILLRNLSDKLVNGLRGPVVNFQSVGVHCAMKRVKFTGKRI